MAFMVKRNKGAEYNIQLGEDGEIITVEYDEFTFYGSARRAMQTMKKGIAKFESKKLDVGESLGEVVVNGEILESKVDDLINNIELDEILDDSESVYDVIINGYTELFGEIACNALLEMFDGDAMRMADNTMELVEDFMQKTYNYAQMKNKTVADKYIERK